MARQAERRDQRPSRQCLVAGTAADMALSPKALLAVRMADYRGRNLTVGLISYELHSHVIAGLSHRAQLFPWPWSATTLDARLSKFVESAGIPGSPKPFLTLRDCAREEFNLLDRLDLVTDFEPVKLPPSVESQGEEEEELADPTTIVGYAQRYPELRLELKDNTAYLGQNSGSTGSRQSPGVLNRCRSYWNAARTSFPVR